MFIDVNELFRTIVSSKHLHILTQEERDLVDESMILFYDKYKHPKDYTDLVNIYLKLLSKETLFVWQVNN